VQARRERVVAPPAVTCLTCADGGDPVHHSYTRTDTTSTAIPFRTILFLVEAALAARVNIYSPDTNDDGGAHAVR